MSGVSQIAASVDESIRPILEAEGYDLVLTEYIPHSQVLRVYIDKLGAERPALEAGVSLDDCAQVSHLVGDLLDAEGLSEEIDGSYRLEVSSPGLDRPLARPVDFVRFQGRQVQVVAKRAIRPETNQRKATGVLLEADPEPTGGIRLELQGETLALDYDGIAKARLVPEF